MSHTWPGMGCCLGTGWASVGWWSAIVFHLLHLSFLAFISLSFFFFLLFSFSLHYYYYFTSVMKLFLPQPTSFLSFTLSVLSPVPLGWGVSKLLCGAQLPAEVKPQHT